MKPPIPNIIAHYSEEKSSLFLPLVLVLVIVVFGIYLYYNKKESEEIN